MSLHLPNRADVSDLFLISLDTPAELVKGYELPCSPANVQMRREQLEGARGWWRVHSEPEARKLLTQGDPTLTKLVQEIAEQVQEQVPPPQTRRRVGQWREEGDEVAVDRMLSGSDTPWRATPRKVKAGIPIVELVLDWGDGCGDDDDRLKVSGAQAVALTQLLEQAGYGVELALLAACHSESSSYGHGTCLIRVELKHAGEPLVVDTLATVAAHPAIWRVYGLRLLELAPWIMGGFRSHGHESPFRHGPETGAYGRPGRLTIRLRQAGTPAHAVRNIVQVLEALEAAYANPFDARLVDMSENGWIVRL